MDDIFADLELALAEQNHEKKEIDLARELDAERKRWCIRTNAPTTLALGGPCTQECSKRAEKVDFRIYKSGHVCSMWCDQTNVSLHDQINNNEENHDQINNNNSFHDQINPSLHDHKKSTSVAWCPRHERIHVCLPESCDQYEHTDLGFGVCVLTGLVVKSAHTAAFGDGSGQAKLSDETESRIHSNTAQRSMVRRNETTAQLIAPDIIDYNNLEIDVPAIGLFGAMKSQNTFGDSLDGLLLEIYAVAYMGVDRYLWSDERAKIEERTVNALNTAAQRKIQSYYHNGLSRGQVVFISVAAQIYDRCISSRRIFSRIALPPNSIPRLRAYYAMRVVEWIVNILGIGDEWIAAKTDVKTETLAMKFRSFSFIDLVPATIDMLRDGIPGKRWIVEPDPFLYMAPEPATVEELGVSQKTVNSAKRTMRRIVAYALTLGIDESRLATTRLDMNVIFAPETPSSVVAAFLAARSARI